MHIGVDIGGTFTDIVVLEDGALRIHKLSSTPDDPRAVCWRASPTSPAAT